MRLCTRMAWTLDLHATLEDAILASAGPDAAAHAQPIFVLLSMFSPFFTTLLILFQFQPDTWKLFLHDPVQQRIGSDGARRACVVRCLLAGLGLSSQPKRMRRTLTSSFVCTHDAIYIRILSFYVSIHSLFFFVPSSAFVSQFFTRSQAGLPVPVVASLLLLPFRIRRLTPFPPLLSQSSRCGSPPSCWRRCWRCCSSHHMVRAHTAPSRIVAAVTSQQTASRRLLARGWLRLACCCRRRRRCLSLSRTRKGKIIDKHAHTYSHA